MPVMGAATAVVVVMAVAARCRTASGWRCGPEMPLAPCRSARLPSAPRG